MGRIRGYVPYVSSMPRIRSSERAMASNSRVGRETELNPIWLNWGEREREMSTFSFPERPVSEIIGVLAKTGIAAPKPEELANPTADLVCSIYANFLGLVDPLIEDLDGQISFTALEILENPDHHADSIRAFDLYRRVKDTLASIHINNFTLRDLLTPDYRRTIQILSNIVNFLYHRDEKLNMLKPIVDELEGHDERKAELEAKIAELNQQILDHEVARQKEEPMVREVEAEVKELRQTIQSYNKQQASLKTLAIGLKEKIDAIDEKISKVDFEILQNGQEHTDLLSSIVQSPDKLQRALEVKKSSRTEVKNSERLAEQRVQEQTATLEVYSKTFEKISKHLAQVQAIQEQVNSAKIVDKDVKTLKATLSDEGVSNMTLEAKITEWQGKAKQAEELVKATEKEKDMRHTDDTQRLNSVRTEMEKKMNGLEPRERKIQAVVAKGEYLCSEADLVREAGKVKQGEIQAKCEVIIDAFHNYSNTIGSCLQRVEAEKEILDTGVEN